ncbi:MAG: S24/S26 family peptidase [Acidobacteriota bacterium]
MPETGAPLSFRPEALLTELLAEGLSVEIPVTGASMSPYIRSRDVITLAPLADEPVRRGDVVAFPRPGGRLVVHRVIDLDDGRILTRGDAAPRADGWIDRETVVGRVTAIERRGRSVRFGVGWGPLAIAMASRTGLLCLVFKPIRWWFRTVQRPKV